MSLIPVSQGMFKPAHVGCFNTYPCIVLQTVDNNTCTSIEGTKRLPMDL